MGVGKWKDLQFFSKSLAVYKGPTQKWEVKIRERSTEKYKGSASS